MSVGGLPHGGCSNPERRIHGSHLPLSLGAGTASLRRMVWAWRRASLTGPLYGRGLRPPVKTHGPRSLSHIGGEPRSVPDSCGPVRLIQLLAKLASRIPFRSKGSRDPRRTASRRMDRLPPQEFQSPWPPISETQMTLYSVPLDVICPSLGVSLGLGIQESADSANLTNVDAPR